MGREQNGRNKKKVYMDKKIHRRRINVYIIRIVFERPSCSSASSNRRLDSGFRVDKIDTIRFYDFSKRKGWKEERG